MSRKKIIGPEARYRFPNWRGMDLNPNVQYECDAKDDNNLYWYGNKCYDVQDKHHKSDQGEQ